MRDQKAYYREEVKVHSYTDERLQHLTLRFLHLAIASTVAYLVFHLLIDTRIFSLLPGSRSLRAAVECMIAKREGGYEWVGVIRRVATVLGAGLPAWAAAFSALRSQGEHTQIAARYGGQITALAGIEREFERLIDNPPASNPIRAQGPEWGSAELTALAIKATAMLTDEVHHWHSMLLTKEIERP